MTRVRVETLEYTPRRIVIEPAGQAGQHSGDTAGTGSLQPVDIVESLPINPPDSPNNQTNGQTGDSTDAR